MLQWLIAVSSIYSLYKILEYEDLHTKEITKFEHIIIHYPAQYCKRNNFHYKDTMDLSMFTTFSDII